MSESFFKRLTLLQRETPAVTKTARTLISLIGRAFARIRPVSALAEKSPGSHYSKRRSQPADGGLRTLRGLAYSFKSCPHQEKQRNAVMPLREQNDAAMHPAYEGLCNLCRF
jgi:hypothetical protein